MDSEMIAGMIIMAFCCFGCGATFSCIASWAQRSEKPVSFWSGTKVDPKTISDIPGYNHENAVMWNWYAVPYYFAGIIGCLEPFCNGATIAAAIILFLACFPGIFILVWNYKRIEKQYKRT